VSDAESLAKLVDATRDTALEELSHFVTEPAAEALGPSHPGAAARLYRAVAMRVVEAGKSPYYPQAVESLRLARECYARAGQQAAWRELVDRIEVRHSRKRSFMGSFARMLKSPHPEPTYLERAHAKWQTRHAG
ncbi:MAG: DUF6880 family protein, partial [Candidatus Xenobia bacterium]